MRADEFDSERVDEFGPTDADERVVKESEELNHVSAPILPPKLKWSHTTFPICRSEAGALRVFVAVDFHWVTGKSTRRI